MSKTETTLTETGMQVALRKMRANVVPDTSMSVIAEAFDGLLKELRYALRCAETHSLGDLANHCRAAIQKAEGRA